MRYLKYFALLAVLMLPLAYSQGQVAVGVRIGGPGYLAGPPVCAYGYYPYYPYGCAPYGYYGPSYFVDGIFVGAGPWYHWGHPAWFWSRGWDRDDWRWHDRDGWRNRGFYGRGYAHGYVRGYDRAYNRGYGRGEFRGGEGFRGGFHEGFHGGRR